MVAVRSSMLRFKAAEPTNFDALYTEKMMHSLVREQLGAVMKSADLAVSGNPRWSCPHVPSLDTAGVADAVVAGIAEWRVGDRSAAHGVVTLSGTTTFTKMRERFAREQVVAGV